MGLNSNLKNLLGVKTNVPKIDWYSYNGIIVAPPKFGKTTLASKLPNSILLAFEKGYDSLGIDVKEIYEWSDFVDFVDTLEDNIAELGSDLKMLVFDTAHIAFEKCGDYILKKRNRELGKNYTRLQNIPYAEGLDLRDKEFRKQLDRLASLNIKWIMLGHTAEKTIKKNGQDPYVVVDHDFDKRLADVIVKDASYILVGENTVIKDEDDDSIPAKYGRKFIAKNDGFNKAGGRVYIGQDIEFDTEEEFISQFQDIFKKGIIEKNNLDDKKANEMLKEEEKEVLDKRNEYQEESKKKEELISQIKTDMKNLNPEGRKKIQNFLLETYGDKSIRVLDERSSEELAKILDEISKIK